MCSKAGSYHFPSLKEGTKGEHAGVCLMMPCDALSEEGWKVLEGVASAALIKTKEAPGRVSNCSAALQHLSQAGAIGSWKQRQKHMLLSHHCPPPPHSHSPLPGKVGNMAQPLLCPLQCKAGCRSQTPRKRLVGFQAGARNEAKAHKLINPTGSSSKAGTLTVW